MLLWYGTPWLEPDPNVDPELTSKTVASWRAPAAVDDREGTSFRSPTTIPVLIGLKDRKYFDVLHRDLTAYFPVPEHAEVEDHFRDPKPYWPRWLNRFREKKPASFYRKELNEQIARRLTMNDMAGSDLATIIETIKQQAEKAHPY
jgi:hypothetical protein